MYQLIERFYRDNHWGGRTIEREIVYIGIAQDNHSLNQTREYHWAEGKIFSDLQRLDGPMSEAGAIKQCKRHLVRYKDSHLGDLPKYNQPAPDRGF